MIEPLVSVGIPTHNNPDGLAKTIENMVNQTYTNLEINISVNPTVNEDINEKYQRVYEQYKDVRIRWHFQETDIGLIENYWFVLQKATGMYFMYAQDDDEWSLGFIKGLVFLLEMCPTVPVAMSVVKRRDETGQIFDSYDMKDIKVSDAMRNEKVAFIFMGVWRLQKIQEYARIFSDVAIDVQALLDGGVLIDPNEVYIKGMRHDKAKEQVTKDPLWFFRVYYHVLRGVSIIDWRLVPIVACTNFVWVIRSYMAQILFLLPVDHWFRKSIRKLYRSF